MNPDSVKFQLLTFAIMSRGVGGPSVEAMWWSNSSSASGAGLWGIFSHPASRFLDMF